MSRKRDTNWTRDEITVLLDSIMEITRSRANGGRRTNSREVFEYAAKKLGEKGHTARAEREKCRTKWKKMKEEFTHAKRARETGEGRIAPGIEPFYSRMLDFINGSFDNISPHSTIVRRSSSISSNNNSNMKTSNSNNNSSSSSHNGIVAINDNNHYGNDGANNPTTTPTNSGRFSQGASRASARIAANSNGVSSNDISDTSNTIATRQNNVGGSDFITATPTTSDSNSGPRLNLRPTPGNTVSLHNSANIDIDRSQLTPSVNGASNHSQNHLHSSPDMKESNCDELSNTFSRHNHNNSTSVNNQNNNNSSHNLNNGSFNNSSSNDLTNHLQPAERDADISYRVSTGCRQITIFGDHDVDIKFRGDCVTINKISAEHSTTSGMANNSDT